MKSGKAVDVVQSWVWFFEDQLKGYQNSHIDDGKEWDELKKVVIRDSEIRLSVAKLILDKIKQA